MGEDVRRACDKAIDCLAETATKLRLARAHIRELEREKVDTAAELNHLRRALLSACAALESYATAAGLEPKGAEAQAAYHLARTEVGDVLDRD